MTAKKKNPPVEPGGNLVVGAGKVLVDQLQVVGRLLAVSSGYQLVLDLLALGEIVEP